MEDDGLWGRGGEKVIVKRKFKIRPLKKMKFGVVFTHNNNNYKYGKIGSVKFINQGRRR